MLRRGKPISGSFPAVGAGALWAEWEAWAGGATEEARRGGPNDNSNSAVRQRLCWGSCLLPAWGGASLPEKAKTGNQGMRELQQWSSNLELEGFKQAEGEGQAKCLEEWWDTHGRLDLMAQGGARRRQKTQVFAVSCLWNCLNGLKHKIWIVKSESMTV